MNSSWSWAGLNEHLFPRVLFTLEQQSQHYTWQHSQSYSSVIKMERPLCCSKTKILRRKKAALYFDMLKCGNLQDSKPQPSHWGLWETLRSIESRVRSRNLAEYCRFLVIICIMWKYYLRRNLELWQFIVSASWKQYMSQQQNHNQATAAQTSVKCQHTAGWMEAAFCSPAKEGGKINEKQKPEIKKGMRLQLAKQPDAHPAQGRLIQCTWRLWWQQQVRREEID